MKIKFYRDRRKIFKVELSKILEVRAEDVCGGVGTKSDLRSGVVKQMAVSRDGRFLFTLNEKNSNLQWDLLLGGLFRDLGPFLIKK